MLLFLFSFFLFSFPVFVFIVVLIFFCHRHCCVFSPVAQVITQSCETGETEELNLILDGHHTKMNGRSFAVRVRVTVRVRVRV